MIEPKAAVVILNFNGKYFLEKFLPAIISNSRPYPVIVADNGSTDNSLAFMETTYPQVQLIRNGANFGYAKGYNLALSKIKATYYILLNSDVEVTNNWIEPVLQLMDSDESIGACQPKILDYYDHSQFEYAGAAGGFIDKFGYPFCRGRIFSSIEKDLGQYEEVRQIFWATGACLFVRAQAFIKAGGLDDDYFAHMEEIDLCWRLKNLGYKICVQPASRIYHIGGGTLNKYSKQKTYLNFRNNLTTLTKNHPPEFLIVKILYRLLLDGVAGCKFLLEGQPKHFFAVIRAHFAYYRRLPAILKKRKAVQKIEGFSFTRTEIYQRNIVAEHFLRKKSKFTELHGSFSEHKK